MTDPWFSPGAAPPGAVGVLPQPQPQQPTGAFGFPAPPAPADPRRSGIAVAALVTSVVALLGVIGLTVAFVGSGFAGGFPGTTEDGYELEGTLPQAAPGRVYSPQEVQAEVERVLEADWSTFEDLECEALAFAPDASTSCTGIVDDYETDIELDVVDAVGHITITQYW